MHKPVLSRMKEGKPHHELYTGSDVTEPNGEPVRCHQGCGIENRTFIAQGSKVRFYCLECKSTCVAAKFKVDSSTPLGASSLVKTIYPPKRAPTKWQLKDSNDTPSVYAPVEPSPTPPTLVESSLVPPALVKLFLAPPAPAHPFPAPPPSLFRLISLPSGSPAQFDTPMQVDPPMQTVSPIQAYPYIQIDPTTHTSLPPTPQPPPLPPCLYPSQWYHPYVHQCL